MGDLEQMRQAELRDEEGAAPIHRMHQVVALHRRVERAGQRNGRGIVDADVDAAELANRVRDGLLHLRLVADIAGERQRAAARFLDLGGRRMDRAFELRMRRDRLGGDGDIGPVSRRI